mmetsp:Transcript_7690/g.18780  ORF Transcript_7690/g.18780 Transcript_7690/m.18780 type:complete len:152 (+) Transcript_7690:99-554(+)
MDIQLRCLQLKDPEVPASLRVGVDATAGELSQALGSKYNLYCKGQRLREDAPLSSIVHEGGFVALLPRSGKPKKTGPKRQCLQADAPAQFEASLSHGTSHGTSHETTHGATGKPAAARSATAGSSSWDGGFFPSHETSVQSVVAGEPPNPT